jgi:hypothetical protein
LGQKSDPTHKKDPTRYPSPMPATLTRQDGTGSTLTLEGVVRVVNTARAP